MKTQGTLLILLAVWPLGGSAQDPVNWLVRDEAGCAQVAADVADTAKPTGTSRMALTYLSRCGVVGGEALAEQLLRLRTLSDTAGMNGVVVEVSRIRDATVFAAALELAEDRTATLEARIAALTVLVEYHNPSFVTSFRYYMLPRVAALHPIALHSQQNHGAPLPEDWEELAREAIRGLRDDPTEPEAIRHAAKQALF